ncbi:hypothetical protein NCS52_01078000 [Fusarium sp. LHS14.1]|nr:hypothetical protein NCS52_01078000 [Fusarium sp. LHS14.1]
MNHQQTKSGEVAEILTPSPNTVVRALTALTTIMFSRAVFGYTIFAKVLIIVISGDLEAQNLPFPFLVISFLVYFALFELVCCLMRFCGRVARHILSGVISATLLAIFYRWLVD